MLVLVHENSVLKQDRPHELERPQEVFSSALFLGLWQTGIPLHQQLDKIRFSADSQIANLSIWDVKLFRLLNAK